MWRTLWGDKNIQVKAVLTLHRFRGVENSYCEISDCRRVLLRTLAIELNKKA
jgi:hypothetical protein